MIDLITYLLTGAIAGFMAGLLGIGGGLVIVPALVVLFGRHGFAADTVMHYAVGSSLATIILTSVSSLLAHNRRGSVHWAVVRSMAPLGARLAHHLPRRVLYSVCSPCCW